MDAFFHWTFVLLYFGILAGLAILNNRMRKARTPQDHFLSPLPLARQLAMPEFYLFVGLLGIGLAVFFVMGVPFHSPR